MTKTVCVWLSEDKKISRSLQQKQQQSEKDDNDDENYHYNFDSDGDNCDGDGDGDGDGGSMMLMDTWSFFFYKIHQVLIKGNFKIFKDISKRF